MCSGLSFCLFGKHSYACMPLCVSAGRTACGPYLMMVSHPFLSCTRNHATEVYEHCQLKQKSVQSYDSFSFAALWFDNIHTCLCAHALLVSMCHRDMAHPSERTKRGCHLLLDEGRVLYNDLARSGWGIILRSRPCGLRQGLPKTMSSYLSPNLWDLASRSVQRSDEVNLQACL